MHLFLEIFRVCSTPEAFAVGEQALRIAERAMLFVRIEALPLLTLAGRFAEVDKSLINLPSDTPKAVYRRHKAFVKVIRACGQSKQLEMAVRYFKMSGKPATEQLFEA